MIPKLSLNNKRYRSTNHLPKRRNFAGISFQDFEKLKNRTNKKKMDMLRVFVFTNVELCESLQIFIFRVKEIEQILSYNRERCKQIGH